MEDNKKDILRIDDQNQKNKGNIKSDSSFIDSFFLPGGILDPEEVNNTITVYDNQYIVPNSGEIRYLSSNGKNTDQSEIRYAVTLNIDNYFSKCSRLNHCRSNNLVENHDFTEDKEIHNIDDPIDENHKPYSSGISYFDEWNPSRTNECSYSNNNDSQSLLPLINSVENVGNIYGQKNCKFSSPSRRGISSVHSNHMYKEERFLRFSNLQMIKNSSSRISRDFQTEKQKKEKISSIVSGFQCYSKFYNSTDTHAAYCSGSIIPEMSHKESSITYSLKNETNNDIRIDGDFLTISNKDNDFVVCKSSDNISGTESELVSIEGTEINFNRDSTRICGTQHNFQHRLNKIDDKKISPPYHPWRNISGGIHYVSDHVTSSLSYSGTMHNQTVSPINPKYSSLNHVTLPKTKSTVTVDIHNRNSLKSRQRSSLTSTTVIVNDSTSSLHRPPPGFHDGHFTKTTSSNALTFADAVSGSHRRNHDQKPHIKQRQKQQRDACRHVFKESKYNNRQNINRETNLHQHSQQRRQLNYCQEQNQINNYQMNDHNYVNNHNNNYDGDSINSKSSRDVPSTIYLHNKFDGEEEDTLTACAEDSITVLSTPVIPLLYPPVTCTSNCNNGVLHKFSGRNSKNNMVKRNDVNVGKNEDKYLGRITSTMRKTRYDGDINHPKSTILDDITQVEKKRHKFKRQKKKRNRKHIYEMSVSSSTGLYCRFGTGEDLQSHDGYSHFSQLLPVSSRSRSIRNKHDEESSQLSWERREKNSRITTIKDETSASLIGASSMPEATPTSSSTILPHTQKQSHDINGYFNGSLEKNSKSVSSVVKLSQRIYEVGIRKVRECCLIFAYVFMSLGNNKKISSKLKQKNILVIIWTLLHKICLIILNVSLVIAFVTCEIWKVLINFTLKILPRKKRFLFLLPLFCIFVDFSFLITSALLQIFGKFIYIILLLHKLAILEVLESDSAIICYIITCSYPELMTITMSSLPMLPHGTTLVGWYAVLRWLFTPIDMKNTYLYRIKVKETIKLGIQTEVSKVGGNKPNASSEVTQVTLMKATNQVVVQESERVQISNQILSIFRRTIPVLLLIEGATRSQGFIMTLSRLERVLLGYGCAVIRLGYIFTPLVWLCWSIQLSVILCFEANILIGYFLFVVGLSSIRLTHYTASVEDGG